MADDIAALQALSERFGVPGIDLSQIAILLAHLALIPVEVAEGRQILCVLAKGERVFLAMATPDDRRAVDEVEFVTGRKVYPYVALPHVLRETITKAYAAKKRGESYFLGPRVPSETLKQLGLDESKVRTTRVPTGMPTTAPPDSTPSMSPASPGVVVEKRLRNAAEQSELSVSEFGAVSSEVSSVSVLPPELRGKAPDTQGKLVLVVDDEEDIRKLLARLLAQKGFRVLEADRGGLALRLVREHMPDVIVLDAMLPEIHGFDIAKRIKGSERYGRIPIVMVSAVYKGWNVASDLKTNYGIDEFIEKPFKIADVVAAIGRVLSAKKEKDASSPPERDPEALHGDAEKALQDGIASYRANNFDRAIEHLRRGIAIDPLAYRLHFHLALLYGKRDMVYEAIHELERARDLNPKHFAAQKNLAVLYEKAGFKQKAVEIWTRCIQLAPDDETRASVKQHLMHLL